MPNYVSDEVTIIHTYGTYRRVFQDMFQYFT